MHTIKLKVKDSIYDHIMFLLKSLNPKELEIVEDKTTSKIAINKTTDALKSNKKINTLPNVFYKPEKKNKYNKFNREDIYNG